MIATNAEHFAHGGREFIHASPEQLHEVRPIEHGIDIRPTAASLAPGAGHASPPPQEFAERKVVQMGPTNDTRYWVHEEGRQAPEHVGARLQPVSPVTSARVTERGEPPQTENPSDKHSEASARAELRGEPSERHGDQHEQMRATPSVTPVQQGKLPSATAAEQHANSSGNPGANHTAPVERMRPPPPPSFSEWRNQQQSSKVQENHTPGAVGNATAQPPISPAHNSEPTHTVAPAQQNGAHPNLPGEPAMKLRPATVASGPKRTPNGHGSCKEHECR